MTVENKKRGRPKSERTKERERIDEMLKNPPPHVQITKKRKKELADWLESLDQIEATILKEHQSPPMPARLVWAVEDVGGEHMTEENNEKALEDYAKAKEIIRQGQIGGGDKVRQKKENRIKIIINKNKDLISRKHATARSIATRILDEWEVRGDGEGKPSERTLRGWLSDN